ncbi:Uncharacterized protein Fot_26315 [Forsythia ovata]|uniref:Uncharacterized protein n=1 Tax=Forsythia ovata TaxID=205694 RepID=A0ABD1UBL5_9LAMI
MDMVSERSRCFAKYGHGIRAVPLFCQIWTWYQSGFAGATPHLTWKVKDNDVFGADLIGVATVFAKRIAAGQVSEGELFPIAPWEKANIVSRCACDERNAAGDRFG